MHERITRKLGWDTERFAVPRSQRCPATIHGCSKSPLPLSTSLGRWGIHPRRSIARLQPEATSAATSWRAESPAARNSRRSRSCSSTGTERAPLTGSRCASGSSRAATRGHRSSWLCAVTLHCHSGLALCVQGDERGHICRL